MKFKINLLNKKFKTVKKLTNYNLKLIIQNNKLLFFKSKKNHNKKF